MLKIDQIMDGEDICSILVEKLKSRIKIIFDPTNKALQDLTISTIRDGVPYQFTLFFHLIKYPE